MTSGSLSKPSAVIYPDTPELTTLNPVSLDNTLG